MRHPIPIDPFAAAYFHEQLAAEQHLLQKSALWSLLEYDVLECRDGGLATVHICRRHGQLYAIKAVNFPQSVKSISRADAIREIISMMRVDGHGCLEILKIHHSLVENPNLLLIVLPFCPGGSLRDRIRVGDSPLEEYVFHLLSIANSLSNLHRHGYIHYDLKPENILFGFNQFNEDDPPTRQHEYWQVLVADFGLAWHQEKLFHNPGTRGTLEYASLEQLENRTVTPAIDVWAWGVMAYECLTGTHPYVPDFSTERTGSLNNFIQHIRATRRHPRFIDDLRNHSPSIPPWLQDLIIAALSEDPAHRPTFPQIVEMFGTKCSIALSFPGRSDHVPVTGAQPLNADYFFESIPLAHDLLIQGWPQLEYARDGGTETVPLNRVRIKLGWIRVAEKVAELTNGLQYSEEISKEAIDEIRGLIGYSDNPRSISNQIINNPSQESYHDYNATENWKENDSIFFLSDKIPSKFVLHLLDCYLINLIRLIEIKGISNFRDELQEIVSYCNKIGDLPSVEYLIHVSQCYLLLGEEHECFKYLRLAMHMDENDIHLNEVIAIVSMSLKDDETSERYSFRTLEIIGPDISEFKQPYIFALIRLSTIYYAREDYEKMVQCLGMTYKTSHALPFVVSILYALYLTKTGNIPQAKELWSNSIEPVIQQQVPNLTDTKYLTDYLFIHQEYELCMRYCRIALDNPVVKLPTRVVDRQHYEGLITQMESRGIGSS